MPFEPHFKSRIPARPGASVPDAAQGQAAPPDPGTVVLLVDDHDLVRATMAEALSDLGYRVVEARSGEEAVGLLDGGLEAGMMVTDHVMPGISGAELAALARARRPGLPVLLVTGHSDPGPAPADLPFLTKPFRKATLAARLADLRRPARVSDKAR